MTWVQWLIGLPVFAVLVVGATGLVLTAIKAADRSGWVARVNRQFAAGPSASWVGPRQQPEADDNSLAKHRKASR